MPISTNSNEMETKSNKTETKSSTGLEHRQTLRACDLPCNLQIEIES